MTSDIDLPLTVLGPMFDRDVYTASVLQFSEIGTHVITIEAETVDNKTGNVTYALIDETGSLSIDQTSGQVTTSANIEYRGLNESTILVIISATEFMDSQTQITTTAILRMTILNSNYYSPAFFGTAYYFAVPCNAAIGSIIGQVDAHDRDYPPYDDFRYYIDTDSDIIKLKINSATGVVTLADSLLLKTGTTYHVTVDARDVFPPFHYATSFVSVVVGNASVESPLIGFPSELNDTVEISPNSRPGLAITRIIARDGASGSNANLEYDILPQPENYYDFTCASRNVDDIFIINSSDGVIILNRTLANYPFGSCFVIAVSVSNTKFLSTGILKIKLTSNDSIESLESIQKQQEHAFNQQLIIAVVVATVVDVIILIVAIVVVIRKVRPTAHRRQDTATYTNGQLSSLSSKCGAKTGKLFEVGSLEDNLGQRIECSRSRDVNRPGDEITGNPRGRGAGFFAIDKVRPLKKYSPAAHNLCAI